MKTLSTLLLMGVCFTTVAQQSSSKHITTDGRQLQIQVTMEQPGRSIHYSRSFDVRDMSTRAVKTLENTIVDSLERAFNEQPITSRSKKQLDTKQAENLNATANLSNLSALSDPYSRDSRNEKYELMADAKSTPSFSPSDVVPSSVLVREDKENGRLWMQYVFEKDGEELVIERTANVIGKSEREKQDIVRETERSFGIKTGNQ